MREMTGVRWVVALTAAQTASVCAAQSPFATLSRARDEVRALKEKGPGAIAVQGSAARMRVHTTEWLVPLEGPARLQHGCYEDQLVREAGRWQFAERSFTVLSTQPF